MKQTIHFSYNNIAIEILYHQPFLQSVRLLSKWVNNINLQLKSNVFLAQSGIKLKGFLPEEIYLFWNLSLR
jgi:hypothetical protein